MDTLTNVVAADEPSLHKPPEQLDKCIAVHLPAADSHREDKGVGRHLTEQRVKAEDQGSETGIGD